MNKRDKWVYTTNRQPQQEYEAFRKTYSPSNPFECIVQIDGGQLATVLEYEDGTWQDQAGHPYNVTRWQPMPTLHPPVNGSLDGYQCKRCNHFFTDPTEVTVAENTEGDTTLPGEKLMVYACPKCGSVDLERLDNPLDFDPLDEEEQYIVARGIPGDKVAMVVIKGHVPDAINLMCHVIENVTRQVVHETGDVTGTLEALADGAARAIRNGIRKGRQDEA